VQTLTIPMRCSKTGGAFTVTFVRQSSSARFRIDAITRPAPSEELLALLAAERPGGPSSAGTSRAGRTESTTHDTSVVDWTGWYCPHCQHGSARGPLTRFVRCGSCHDLVCGGSVRDLGSGRQHFWCHEECGGSGELGDDGIKSYSGSSGVRHQALPAPGSPARAALPAPPKRAALPQPGKGLLKR
jgi:hypothetical protein